MTVSSVATGYDGISLLAGNTGYDPSATFLIQRLSPTSGTTISFTDIPSTYKHLQVRACGIVDSSGAQWRIRFNNDSTSNYISHYLYGTGSSALAGSNQTTFISDFWNESGQGTVLTYPNVSIIDVQDYASTTKNKTVRMFTGSEKNAAGGGIGLDSGLWMSTAAINRIDFIFTGSNFSAGTTFALYGMVG